MSASESFTQNPVVHFRCLASSVRMSLEKPDPSSFTAVLVVTTWN